MLIKTLIFTLFLLHLEACQHRPGLLPPSSCVSQCKQEFQFCKKICLNDCPHCCQYTKSQAKSFYQAYLRRARIEGKPAFSSLHSFYDPLQCNKNSCDCKIDFLLCQQNCQGKISKRLKTYKFC